MSKIATFFALALALCLSTAPALAAKINGKKCTSMVSKQRNPNTNEVTYSCRAEDGSIQTGSSVEEKTTTAPVVPRKNATGTDVK